MTFQVLLRTIHHETYTTEGNHMTGEPPAKFARNLCLHTTIATFDTHAKAMEAIERIKEENGAQLGMATRGGPASLPQGLFTSAVALF
jgi:hypothetical protein